MLLFRPYAELTISIVVYSTIGSPWNQRRGQNISRESVLPRIKLLLVVWSAFYDKVEWSQVFQCDSR